MPTMTSQVEIIQACAAATAPLFVAPKVTRERFTGDVLRHRPEGVRFATRASTAAQSRPVEVPARKWRHRVLAAVGVAAAWLWPKMAYARVAKRVVSRADERRAGLYTALAIGFFFVVAYFNSRKEDDSEEKRIKEEVKRLVRLKKEFEETEEQEELSDDNMAAALRAAQEKMDGKDDEPSEGASKEGEKSGEAEGEAKAEDGTKDGDKKEDDSESSEKDDKEKK
eukprot:symbB.v1.2.019476.t1/scaffold1593.1/size164412/18